MRERPMRAVFVAACIAAGVAGPRAQDFPIGAIDLFGLKQVAAADVRRALTFKEGDRLNFGERRPAVFADSERKLAAVPGIERARIKEVCCDAGKLTVYVGIEERGAASTLRFLAAPGGTVRLTPDIIAAGNAFDAAFSAAIERGDFAEDDTRGHALFHDPATRAVQERFVALAERNLTILRQVLRESSDAGQRALAAQILGYVDDKQRVVNDLVPAMRDPDENVRNNAMRTLAVFTRMSVRPPPAVPYEPFVQMLNSPVWSDRNKSSLMLAEVSARRNPALLRALRENAYESLAEMARWKTAGHAQPAFMILGRIAGLSEDAVLKAWESDDRQSVIDAAARVR